MRQKLRSASAASFLCAAFFSLLLFSANLHAAAPAYVDPTYAAKEKAACNAKQRDLVNKANENIRMPVTVNEFAGTNSTRSTLTNSLGTFGSPIATIAISTFTSGVTSLVSSATNYLKRFVPVGAVAATQFLVRQNPTSCEPKQRVESLRKINDPHNANNRTAVQGEKY